MLGLAQVFSGAGASVGIEIDVGRLNDPRVEIDEARLRLWPSEQGMRLELTAARLVLADPLGVLHDLRLSCPRVGGGGDDLWCANGELVASSRHGSVELEGLRFGWNRATGDLQFGFTASGWLGSRGRYAGYRRADVWGLEFVIDDLAVTRLPDALGVEGWEVLQPTAGRLDLRGRLALERETLLGRLDWGLREFGFSDARGLRAGEGLQFSGSVDLEGSALHLRAASEGGAVFWDPVFWDHAAHGPLLLDLVTERGGASMRGGFGIRRATATLGGQWIPSVEPAPCQRPVTLGVILESGRIDPSGLQSGRIRWTTADLGALSDWLVEPLTAARFHPGLRAQGCAAGEFELVDGELHALSVRLEDLEIAQARDLWHIAIPDGEILWRNDSVAASSRVEVGGGRFLGLPFGAFPVEWTFGPRSLELLGPVRIPVFGGGPLIDTLEVDFADRLPAIRFSGGIRSLDLGELTEALGLPVLSGRLAAIIPRVGLGEAGLRVEGNVLLQVFDGEVVIRDLHVRDLLGEIPVLEASASLRDLDLEAVTGAFELGRIEGRIEGEIEDLTLVDWRPERMDLKLRTPESEPGRRRISQRAIDTLAAVGGDPGAAASLLVLGLFEDFGYRRLGFACELSGDVCEVSGIRDLPDGAFLLVEGGGLPRIDVVGHNRRVDWVELLRRLQAAR